jgi:hypothetical protein
VKEELWYIIILSFDNDALHNKSARSVVFSSQVNTAETVDLVLSQQTDNIKGLQRSIKVKTNKYPI